MTADEDTFGDGDGDGDAGRRQNLLESQLAALFEVSSVLSRSLDLNQTLREVLGVLHQRGRLCKGMVSLVDQETGDLLVSAVHEDGVAPFRSVWY